MRLEQISYFLSVAEHGNITAAARSLYISQPALSKQITLLEQEIGLPLGVHLPEVAEVTEPGVVDQCINGDILLYSDMEEQVGTVLFMTIDLPAFWANK